MLSYLDACRLGSSLLSTLTLQLITQTCFEKFVSNLSENKKALYCPEFYLLNSSPPFLSNLKSLNFIKC
jgi:hypothetical protein